MKRSYQQISDGIDKMLILLKSKNELVSVYFNVNEFEKKWNSIKMNEWRIREHWSKRREMEKELDKFIKDVQKAYLYIMNTEVILPWMKTGSKSTEIYLKEFFDNIPKLDSKVIKLLQYKYKDPIAYHSSLYLKWKIMKKRESEKSIIEAKAKEARRMKKMLEGVVGYFG